MQEQKRMLQSVPKKTKAVAHRNHKILLIGDSHVRGLSEKVGNGLNDAFSVIGVTKPNATTESIISPLKFPTNNLTKKDLIIFMAGPSTLAKSVKKGTSLFNRICTED
jgi:hypothetical protein